MAVTKQQLAAGIQTIKIVADTIRELGSVPSGHLYAQLMSKLSQHEYEQIIGILTRAGLVKNCGHLLVWVEPAK